MANPTDTTFHIIKEVIAGTTPTSPVFLKYDHTSGDSMNLMSDTVTSQVVKQSRASAGIRKVGFRSEGSLKGNLRKDTAADMLMESALSGVFTTNILKAGNTETNFTVEKRFIEGGTSLYARYVGCQVSKFAMSVNASGMSEVTYDIIGTGQTLGTAILAGATYTTAAVTQPLAGIDVGSFTIAGVSGIVARSLELSVEQNREAQDRFGTPNALGIGTSGIRTVKLSATFYRTDWSPETTLIPDTPVAVSFTIGGALNGYTVLLPAAVSTVPMTEEDGSKLLVKVEFTATFDATEATDIKITRL